MKYLVIAGPSNAAMERFGTDPKIAEISSRGFQYYKKLQDQGKLEQYVRLDGPPGSVMIFDVENAEEFARIRAQDPFVPLLGANIKVIPLAKPEAAFELMDRQAAELKQKQAKPQG